MMTEAGFSLRIRSIVFRARNLVVSALFLGVVVAPAVADEAINQVLRSQSTEWADGFDSSVAGMKEVRTAVPILSPETVAAMRVAIERYSSIVASGGWPVVPGDKVLRLGMRDPSIRILRQRLMVSGDLPQSAGISDAFNSYVDEAVRRFQARHGVPADGIVGQSTFAMLNIPAAIRLAQLSKNMERLSELVANPGDRYVLVNIPAAVIEAVDLGRVVSRHTAVVGKIDRQTPILASKIYEVNFNPFWTVPASIIKKDLIPLMQRQPTYLDEQRIRAYDQRGNEIRPEQIDWNSDEATNYMFRQDPGDFNSLGSVRINFYNKHAVYMHDTPSKTLFGDEYRFDSSGCVRVQNVRELIAWLLQGTEGWQRESVDELFRNNQRLDVKLAKPVPVYFSYLTAWSMQDGVVHFRNDIYLQDGLDQLALR